jgi:cell wall-associated NlpC family hydrolase
MFLNAWARAEGGSASNNPFNTTQRAPGASSYNSVGVRNYATPSQGIGATVATLNNGRYENILAALKAGNDARAAASALANSPWGTGSLVLKVLGGAAATPPTAPLPAVQQEPVRGRLSVQQLAVLNQGNRLFGLPELPSILVSSAPSRQPTPGASVPSAALPATNFVAPATPSHIKGTVKGTKAINLAAHFLGVPYVWGGTSPKGFDCSGLLQYVWAKQGVQIPRTTYDQFKAGSPVNAKQLQPGDAVFFKGSDSKMVNGQVLPGHVGIYIGGGKYIEAPHTGANVRISSLSKARNFMGARRFA